MPAPVDLTSRLARQRIGLEEILPPLLLALSFLLMSIRLYLLLTTRDPRDYETEWVLEGGALLFGIAAFYAFHRQWSNARARRLTQLYATLTQGNRIIVSCANMNELLGEVCRGVVQHGWAKLAWIGMVDDKTARLVPVAFSGDGAESVEAIDISTKADIPVGRGPVGTAVRENHPVWLDDYLKHEDTTPWREQGKRAGWRTMGALPIQRDGQAIGALCIYTNIPHCYSQIERALFEEMVQNISYALDNFARVEARLAAEEQLRNVLSMMERFFDNMPGSVYIKDSESRFLFASRGFVEMFGFEPRDIVGKSNLELFPAEIGEKMNDDERLVLKSGGTLVVNEMHGGRHFEAIRFVIEDQPERKLLGGITLDISQRHMLMARQQALLELNELGDALSEEALLKVGLGFAKRLTGSAMAFLLLVGEEGTVIDGSFCTEAPACCEHHRAHCIVPKLGYWEDGIRNKKVALHNDYERALDEKGLPLGSVPMSRVLAVPVIEDEVVRMIVGVANKPAPYDNADIVTILLLGNDLWRIVHRRRVVAGRQKQLEELKVLNQKLEETHRQLVQSEKMAAIGQLAAGVAHEINNPVSYVQSNLHTLAEYLDDMMTLDRLYLGLEQKMQGKEAARIQAFKKQVGYDDIVSDIQHLIKESREGLDRVGRIVQDLREFSHAGEKEWQWVNLHDGLERTINIVRSVVNEKFELTKEYDELPKVYCRAAQLNQVFLNLLVNAAQSVEQDGQIHVRSRRQGEYVSIEIQDNGQGIDPEDMKRLFEPFFTTKSARQGTGLGLSLSWNIVQRHHGNIEVHSEPGIQTRFTVKLPIDPRKEAA